MLKWWWNHYTKQNTYPVTFFDYGMSKSAKMWCEEKGKVIPFVLPEKFTKHQASFSFPKTWHLKTINYFTDRRKVWFTKAFSLFKTPYEKSVWIDLDCEVIKSIKPLFEFCESRDGFAITYDVNETTKEWKDDGLLSQNADGHQVGVFSFKRKSPVMNKWIQSCYHNHTKELTEQTCLNHILEKENFDITIFSKKYNWVYLNNKHPDATILHYAGPWPKRELLSNVNT